MTLVPPETLALQRFYQWERSTPTKVTFTQPMGGGVVRDFTWAQVADETRRMAAHLKSLGFAPGTRIGILSKNCAYWLMSDLAIWMAGYVSVPLYPTLAADTIRQIIEHSEMQACFVGKLDGWEAICPAFPTRSRRPIAIRPGTTSFAAPRRWLASPCATAASSRPSSTPRARPACPRA